MNSLELWQKHVRQLEGDSLAERSAGVSAAASVPEGSQWAAPSSLLLLGLHLALMLHLLLCQGRAIAREAVLNGGSASVKAQDTGRRVSRLAYYCQPDQLTEDVLAYDASFKAIL